MSAQKVSRLKKVPRTWTGLGHPFVKFLNIVLFRKKTTISTYLVKYFISSPPRCMMPVRVSDSCSLGGFLVQDVAILPCRMTCMSSSSVVILICKNAPCVLTVVVSFLSNASIIHTVCLASRK